MPAKQPGLFLSPTQAAAFLGISKPTFYRQIQQGAIPPGIKLPATIRGQWWHRDVLVEIANRWACR